MNLNFADLFVFLILYGGYRGRRSYLTTRESLFHYIPLLPINEMMKNITIPRSNYQIN